VALPDLGGKSLQQVTDELAALGLTVGDVKRVYDENWDKDIVLGSTPSVGQEAPKGSPVALVVSDGPQPRTVPSDLVGSTKETAEAALRAIGLVPSSTEAFSEDVEKGRVMDVDPGEGASVPRDSTVSLVVSAGPPTVTIPSSIVGASVTDATTTLQNLGLSVSSVQGSPLNKVASANPAPGTEVRRGTSVTLTTG
jgi:serine/threonine-protein kinase